MKSLAVLWLLALVPAGALASDTPRPKPTQAPREDLRPRIAELMRALALPPLEGPGIERCVGILDGDGSQEPERVLLGLVRREISESGGGVLGSIGARDSIAALDEAAREAGCEELLLVRRTSSEEQLALAAELRVVDRGMWAPMDEPVVARAAEVVWPRPGLRPQEAVPENDGVTPYRLTWLGSVAQRILALAACELGPEGAPVLTAVTPERVLALHGDSGTLAGEWRLAEGGLSRAASRVRDPIAGAVCGGIDRENKAKVSIGQSDYEHGAVLELRAKGRGVELLRQELLPGIPVARTARGALVLASPDQGRNQFNRRLVLLGPEGRDIADLGLPFLELLLPRETGQRGALVTSDYQLKRVSGELRVEEPVGTSGVGAQLIGGGNEPMLVSTSSRAQQRRDRLAFLPARERPIELLAPVQATATRVTRAGTDLWIATRADKNRTDLYRLFIPSGGAR
ncbi:MAG: hypothetical protein U1E65_12575 [Myxococcota bacterium]